MPVPSRRARLIVLSALLGLTLGAALAQRAGWDQYTVAPPFQGRLELGHGVVVEAVDLLAPPARLLVARVPRGRGLRLVARHLDRERAGLRHLGEVAPDEGALVAVNGDYHHLHGFGAGTAVSTLVDRGRAEVVTWAHSYASALLLDRDGAPRIGRPDLSLELRLPGGDALPVLLNAQEGGDALLVTRPPPGAWAAPEHAGFELPELPGALEQGARLRLGARAAAGAARTGPALLVRGQAEAALAALPPGAALEARLGGTDAGRVQLVLGTGPRLVEDGAVAAVLRTPEDGGWSVRHARTAVGLTSEALLLVVTWQAPRQGLSFEALARALIALGCREATNLDGGPSSTLWAAGRALNVPGPGEDTEVATGLFVLPPAQGQPGLR